jgi:chromosome segregation ATPase
MARANIIRLRKDALLQRVDERIAACEAAITELEPQADERYVRAIPEVIASRERAIERLHGQLEETQRELTRLRQLEARALADLTADEQGEVVALTAGHVSHGAVGMLRDRREWLKRHRAARALVEASADDAIAVQLGDYHAYGHELAAYFTE